MLRRLIAWSINHSRGVLVMAAAVLLLAGWVLTQMPVDVFPELNAPTVVVLTEAGGLTAEEVESQVTHPLESTMTGLPSVRRVRSASATGLSLIWVEFDWGADIYRARQLVGEKLNMVREQLPAAAHPELGPVSSLAGEIMLISVRSESPAVDDMALRTLAEFSLRPGLLAVSGVSQIVAIGGRLPEFQVQVDPDALLLHDLTLSDVVGAATEAHSTASAGYLLNVGGQEQPISQDSQVRSPSEVAETVVRVKDGVALTLGRVTDVRLAGAVPRGAASSNGAKAVVMSVQKAPGTNTLAVTRAIDEALDKLEATLPAGVSVDRHAFRQARFIETSIHNLRDVTRDAIIIVAIIVLLFLMDLRAALITLTALPLSLAVAIIAMWALDMSINVMTLGGLAVAVGALVDDAIIDVENVMRRLRERGEDESVLHVIFTASDEIRAPVVYATLIICVVFVPLLLMQGLEGRFFRPLAFAYIVAVLASLLVALTVTPALCRHLLKRVKRGGDGGSLLVRALQAVYRPLLRLSLRLRWLVLAGTVALTAAAVLLGSTFGSSFLPGFNEGSLTVFVTAPPGTSLLESDRLGQSLERGFVALEGVKSVTRRTGRAERDEHAEPVWRSEIDITFVEGAKKVDVRARVDTVLESVKGVTTSVGQPIEHRLSHILSGTPAALAVNIYGDDLATLRVAVKQAEAVLTSVKGTRDVVANREQGVLTLPIRYNRPALARYGLTPAAAAEQIHAAFSGAVVGTVRDGLRVYDLVVRLGEEQRRTPEQLKDLVLRGSGGAMVRVRDVATVAPDRSPYLITREGGRRKAVVSANIADGANLGHVVEEVERKLKPMAASLGVTVELGGQFEAREAATRTLAFSGLAVFLLVLMLLHASLGSLKGAILVAVNLPLGLIGGVVAIFIAESAGVLTNAHALLHGHDYIPPVMSLASLVGFVTLFGIAVRNGVLMVNHYAWLQDNEGLSPLEAVIRGSSERLAPVLMTAITAVLGLVPLALAAGQPGSELLAPLAVVVLGGLTTSTLLNLIVVPAGYIVMFGEAGMSRSEDRYLRLDHEGNLMKPTA